MKLFGDTDGRLYAVKFFDPHCASNAFVLIFQGDVPTEERLNRFVEQNAVLLQALQSFEVVKTWPGEKEFIHWLKLVSTKEPPRITGCDWMVVQGLSVP